MANLKVAFGLKQIEKAIDQFIEEQDAKTILRLKFIGETFINDAKRRGNYTDRTGNLRSSIGYIILKDGKPISNMFSGKPQGVARGKQFAEELRQEYPEGFVLIGVAGMNYAAYVEAKNYDVISGSVPSETLINQIFGEV